MQRTTMVFAIRFGSIAVLACGQREEADGDATTAATAFPGEDDGGASTSSDEGPRADEGEGGERFDLGSDEPPAEGGTGCRGPDGGPPGGTGDEYSYIWIANSPEGTVSKIDTRSAMEIGRYYTGPSMGTDDPSRTSVNLIGDVAVSNRAGGIVKIAADVSRCVDRSGDGVIQTSTGPGDVLAWDAEECRLWYLPIEVEPGSNLSNPNSQGPRPTAWDLGESLDPCAMDHRVWVGWYGADAQVAHVRRLAGADGSVLDSVDVPGWPSNLVAGYGPYGGAVDPHNNVWVLGLAGPLARIDGTTLEVRVFPVPAGTQPYGIAVDHLGNPWMAGLDGSVLRFDATAETFEVLPVGGRLRGLQIDREGFAWVANGTPDALGGGFGGGGGCGAAKIDTATRTVVQAMVTLPDCSEPVGVSIDVDGFVWLPDKRRNGAFKLDPDTLTTTFVAGLVAPYTYSDMTGAGLGLVAFPPTG